jgi:hypothetical protein
VEAFITPPQAQTAAVRVACPVGARLSLALSLPAAPPGRHLPATHENILRKVVAGAVCLQTVDRDCLFLNDGRHACDDCNAAVGRGEGVPYLKLLCPHPAVAGV